MMREAGLEASVGVLEVWDLEVLCVRVVRGGKCHGHSSAEMIGRE